MTDFKALAKQGLQFRGEEIGWGGNGGGAIGNPSAAVGEMAGGDAFFNGGWISRTEIDASEGVGSFHQQLEDENS